MEMSYTKIDLNEWSRGKLFKSYIENMRIVMSLTVEIDVTNLIEFSKRNNLKFYPSMIWIVSKVVNTHDALAPQALGQAGLIFQNLTLDIPHRGVHSAAHIPVRRLRLGPEQRTAIPDGDLHGAQVVLLHGEEHVNGGIVVPKVLLQLRDLLLGVVFDGVVQGDFLTGVWVLHRDRSFRVDGRRTLPFA